MAQPDRERMWPNVTVGDLQNMLSAWVSKRGERDLAVLVKEFSSHADLHMRCWFSHACPPYGSSIWVLHACPPCWFSHACPPSLFQRLSLRTPGALRIFRRSCSGRSPGRLAPPRRALQTTATSRPSWSARLLGASHALARERAVVATVPEPCARVVIR